jgi:hypothetical protein
MAPLEESVVTTLWFLVQLYRSFEMRCWRLMERITWTDRVRSEEVLPEDQEERNILHSVTRRTNWIGHMWRKIGC